LQASQGLLKFTMHYSSEHLSERIKYPHTGLASSSSQSFIEGELG